MASSTNLATKFPEISAGTRDPQRLAGTNINPATGLATDYLNHFNEAIMLLEMVTESPDCREDLLAWQPKSYTQHFAESCFKHRELAIAAYETADPDLRQHLDALADAMNGILLATREVMRQELSTADTGAIASLAVQWVKPLIGRAGLIINGAEPSRNTAQHVAPQIAVDAVMAR